MSENRFSESKQDDNDKSSVYIWRLYFNIEKKQSYIRGSKMKSDSIISFHFQISEEVILAIHEWLHSQTLSLNDYG